MNFFGFAIYVFSGCLLGLSIGTLYFRRHDGPANRWLYWLFNGQAVRREGPVRFFFHNLWQAAMLVWNTFVLGMLVLHWRPPVWALAIDLIIVGSVVAAFTTNLVAELHVERRQHTVS